jgi:hypothetical protein
VASAKRSLAGADDTPSLLTTAILETLRAQAAGTAVDDCAFETDLTHAVAVIVRRQVQWDRRRRRRGVRQPSFSGYVLGG